MNIAWANVGKTFSPVKNLSNYQGQGVWIYGDGKGELFNIQVRDGSAFGSPIADHYVDINFTGWKYVELIESESDRYWDYSWPYGWEYTTQFLWVNYGSIQYFNM